MSVERLERKTLSQFLSLNWGRKTWPNCTKLGTVFFRIPAAEHILDQLYSTEVYPHSRTAVFEGVISWHFRTLLHVSFFIKPHAEYTIRLRTRELQLCHAKFPQLHFCNISSYTFSPPATSKHSHFSNFWEALNSLEADMYMPWKAL